MACLVLTLGTGALGTGVLACGDGANAPATTTVERPAPVEEWPQWGGPRRNFTSKTPALAAEWPEEGPPRLWRRALGEGFSAISVRDGTLYTMYREGDDEVVIAMDAATGRTLWEHAYAAPIDDSYNMDRGPGPHATPLVEDELVFTVGATAILHAIDRETGEPRWRRDLIEEFGGTKRDRGYAASPLAWRDTLILSVGGEDNSLMSLRQSDGSVVWGRHNFVASPSSPLLIEVDGQEQVAALMGFHLVGVSPEDGRLLWAMEHRTELGQNVSTPVWGEDNMLYTSAGYGVGSRGVRLVRNGEHTRPEVVWHNKRMRLHFSNAIRIGDFVYGTSGDFGPGFFAAINIHDGRIPWRQRGFGKASFLLAAGRFIILDENGVLGLATPTAEGLEVHSKVQLLDRYSWTVPTLVGTVLYVRDRKNIMAFDLG